MAVVRPVRLARPDRRPISAPWVGSPYLYRLNDPAKLLLENDGDLPRNQEGIALIGDPRNDVHAFMSQMRFASSRPTT
jgi:hypothetical protein